MRIFKRIAAGLIAAVTMAVTGVTAFAGSWTINYTYGAPSSVSNQFVRREYDGVCILPCRYRQRCAKYDRL